MVSDHHLRGDEHQIQALIEQPLTCWPCQNPATNDTFRVKDTCHPETFEQLCPNCHNATCQFTKYISTTDAFGGNWMQWYNLFALYWAVFFVSALSELVLAGVFATWYWTWDKSGMRCCPLCRSVHLWITSMQAGLRKFATDFEDRKQRCESPWFVEDKVSYFSRFHW